MFLDKLFKSIGLFFVGLFNAAAKAWKKISPELQSAMIQGSGIVKIINDNIGKDSSIILDLIKLKYPDLDETKLKEALAKVTADLKLGQELNSDDLVKTLDAIGQHLNGLEGTDWAKASHTIYMIISVFLAPAGTKVAAIISLAEYVYHQLVKKA